MPGALVADLVPHYRNLAPADLAPYYPDFAPANLTPAPPPYLLRVDIAGQADGERSWAVARGEEILHLPATQG
jgi:hypothetical protein